jgi:hypothetical protein
MKNVSLGLLFGLLGGASVISVGCGGGDTSYANGDDGSTDSTQQGDDGSSPEGTTGDDGSANDGTQGGDGGSETSPPGDGACGTCPTGYTCGTANGMSVCRAPSGIPLFSNIFVILMENTSLSTLQPAMTGGTAPYLQSLATKYATGSNYLGVDHPSLPNYIALTSGGEPPVACDCLPTADAGTCVTGVCLIFPCSCPSAATNIADQIQTAGKTWKNFAEDMVTPCNLVSSGNYATKHVPFLYYTDLQASSCAANVVDFSTFNPASPANFNFISPNLIDDMHDPDPTNSTNIPTGDTWLKNHVPAILSSAAYTQGGLLVIVWDEDDNSTGNNPIPIFVMSPYAKSSAYVSATQANHYSLLATFEDGLGLPRLGLAASPTVPLKDYFPAN